MTIPLSLIGQMIEYSQTSSVSYWIGAGVVFLSFVFINHESSHEGGRNPEIAGIDNSPVREDEAHGELWRRCKNIARRIWPQRL